MQSVASDKRFSIVPTDPREKEAVLRAAKILRCSLKDLVMAAMRRGLREIILDRDKIDTPPLNPEGMLRAGSIQELKELVRMEGGLQMIGPNGQPLADVTPGGTINLPRDASGKIVLPPDPPAPPSKPAKRPKG